MSEPKIIMINSDFSVNYNIDRYLCNDILNKKYYKFSSTTFEPCIYAAVKCKYFSKSGHDVKLSIFRTGKILIKGANSFEQIDEAYNFITVFFETEKEYIIDI
jgi:TATA-box binding protein (TBP) (component of TFIID and TFIIIB)